MKHVWKVVATFVMVAVGVMSIGGAALAQEEDGEETPPPPLPTMPMMGMFGPGHMPLEIVADTLGMTREELLTELRAEKTVAEIAEEQGVERDTLVDALAEPLEEKVAELVEGDYLDDAQANAIVTLLRAMIDQRLDRTWTPPEPRNGGRDFGRGRFPNRPGAARIALDIVADTLNMSQDDLLTELKEQKTVAEIAEEQSVELETVVDNLMDPISENVQEQVENGRISQEDADGRLENIEEKITERLQQPFPMLPDCVPDCVPDGDERGERPARPFRSDSPGDESANSRTTP